MDRATSDAGAPGEEPVPWRSRRLLYAFFLVHMAMFGTSNFFLAYGTDPLDVLFLYMHGGVALLSYLVFYLLVFGLDPLRWIVANGLLGLFGIWAEVDLLLGLFGRSLADYPWYAHVTPFLYYILYTFLLRQAVLDFSGARGNPARQRRVQAAYVTFSALCYAGLWLLR